MAPVDSDPARALLALLREAVLKPHEIARALDSMSHEERVDAIRATGRSEQRRLYEAVAGVRPLRLTDMVPPSRPALAPVRHYGKNTLPAFTHFEKRFCRPPVVDPVAPDELWGYNQAGAMWLVGPGYFVLRPDRSRGELLVDYTRVPPERPPEWPRIRANERGLSRFVYGFMVDTLRGVSEHVTVGSAARRGKDLGSWFLLCREA
jgi:hypothetical protein